jgi:2'-5' RNA ligase
METIRSFIAVALPVEISAIIAGMEKQLMSRAGAPVKWVEPHTLHLTLKFLGDVETGKIDAISEAVRGAVAGINPFSIDLTVSRFP